MPTRFPLRLCPPDSGRLGLTRPHPSPHGMPRRPLYPRRGRPIRTELGLQRPGRGYGRMLVPSACGAEANLPARGRVPLSARLTSSWQRAARTWTPSDIDDARRDAETWFSNGASLRDVERRVCYSDDTQRRRAPPSHQERAWRRSVQLTASHKKHQSSVRGAGPEVRAYCASGAVPLRLLSGFWR